MPVIRQPAVAGRFYPADQRELAATVDGYLAGNFEREPVAACVVPHAGYLYSGSVAGAVYGAMEVSKRVIVLGPNHTSRGAPLAVTTQGGWATPLGIVPIDEPLALELSRAISSLQDDVAAHQTEHSIEVQLPFLQRKARTFRFVPICVGTSDRNELLALGAAIASTLQGLPQQVLIVCSSDMNHYEPDDVTRIKDRMAIAPMLNLDPIGLHEVIHRERISMCGFAPAVAMLEACRRLGIHEGKVLKYATSADVSGDRSDVVGYAGLVFKPGGS